MISESMRQAFWDKVEVQRTGAISGLDEGLQAFLKAAIATSHDIAQGEAEPVAFEVKMAGDYGWVSVSNETAAEFHAQGHQIRPLFTVSPDAAATIASLEHRVVVAAMEREGEDAGKKAIAELLGVTDEIRWKWIRNAVLNLKERVAEAERVIAFLNAHVDLELTWGEIDGWEDDCQWRVHRVNGGRNDREWTLIGHGATVELAVSAAAKWMEDGK